MNANVIFVSGLVITAGVCFAVVRYIRTPLLKILTDICGNAERAGFWVAFTTVILLTVPVIFAMFSRPVGLPADILFEISDQVQAALIGLVLSVVTVGFALARSIARGRKCEKHAELASAVVTPERQS